MVNWQKVIMKCIQKVYILYFYSLSPNKRWRSWCNMLVIRFSDEVILREQLTPFYGTNGETASKHEKNTQNLSHLNLLATIACFQSIFSLSPLKYCLLIQFQFLHGSLVVRNTFFLWSLGACPDLTWDLFPSSPGDTPKFAIVKYTLCESVLKNKSYKFLSAI